MLPLNAAIAAGGVTISKGGRILVADAAFAIQPNAFVGVLGPSGAGQEHAPELHCQLPAGGGRTDRLRRQSRRYEDRDEIAPSSACFLKRMSYT